MSQGKEELNERIETIDADVWADRVMLVRA